MKRMCTICKVDSLLSFSVKRQTCLNQPIIGVQCERVLFHDMRKCRLSSWDWLECQARFREYKSEPLFTKINPRNSEYARHHRTDHHFNYHDCSKLWVPSLYVINVIKHSKSSCTKVLPLPKNGPTSELRNRYVDPWPRSCAFSRQ